MRGTQWMMGSAAALALAALIASCGGTGGGGGSKGGTDQQFIRNSNNTGRLILTVDPTEVDANKTDRIGLVAVLTDNAGRGIPGVPITFSTDLDDVTFIPGQPPDNITGIAITDSNGRADIIAVAGSTPTGTGAIVGTGAIFATAPQAFALRAQVQITLYDVGFIDADIFGVVPSAVTLDGPFAGGVLFFTLVGGTPPYSFNNGTSGIGTGNLGQTCLPGCTENGGILCIGSPCQSDSDCNANGSSTPANVCLGPIKRCLASCAGTNCAGARCATDSDCNDGSPTPANVCKDSGQSLAYILRAGCGNGVREITGSDGITHNFPAFDSAGATADISVTVIMTEACDGSDLANNTCQTVNPIFTGGTLACTSSCSFDTSGCTTSTPGSGQTPGPGATFTPGGGVPTPTATPNPGSTAGAASTLELALLSFAGADNGNNTATTVIGATVSDANGNPVSDGTVVTFGLVGQTFGAVITAQSSTGDLPPQCDVANYENRTGVQVLEQPGVAHACITYPIDNVFSVININSASGLASDSGVFELPVALINPQPTPTP